MSPTGLEPTRAEDDTLASSRLRVGVGLALPVLGLVLIGVLRAWQVRIFADGGSVHLNAAPLLGTWRVDLRPELAVAVVVGAALVRWWPRLTRRLGWGRLLAGSWLVTLAWALAVNATGGWRGLGEPLDGRQEYLYTSRNTLSDPFDFLATFVRELRSYPIHVQGHPPGPVLGLEALERLGIAGASGMSLVLVCVACLASPLVLIAVRALVDEDRARAAAVFVGLTPSAMWVATSMDAVFAAVAVAAGTAMALAAVRSGAWHGDDRAGSNVWAGGAMAALGGLLAGLLIHGTYAAPLFLIPGAWCLVVLARHRRWAPIGLAVVAGLLPTVLMAGAGFWLLDGLQGTIEAYHDGVASRRPADFFRLSNPLALGISLGPVVLAALPLRRRAGAWVLVGGTLAGLAIAEISGLSKGEVERIWLPFVPWLTVAAASIPRRWRRPALGLQLSAGVVLTAVFVSPW
ncbi:MAG: hypothetical protein R2704_10020 [Microthrixaceae bacterium]